MGHGYVLKETQSGFFIWLFVLQILGGGQMAYSTLTVTFPWNKKKKTVPSHRFAYMLHISKQSVRCMRFTSSGKYTTANLPVFVDTCRFI
jgi:hypothetical protein